MSKIMADVQMLSGIYDEALMELTKQIKMYIEGRVTVSYYVNPTHTPQQSI